MTKYAFQQRLKRDAAKRADKMRALRAKGKTLQEIADTYGISRQRVHQIVTGKVYR